MPNGRLRRIVSALLPGELRRDVFEPALHDLDADRLREGRGPARFGIVLLFLECWRLAPAEVFSMFLNDLRHAFRLLRRDPVFTATAVLTLTLGVGANVSVFAVVNAVLLRPLPYTDADRLVMIEHRDTRTGVAKKFVAIGDYLDLRARQQAFEAVAGYDVVRTVVHAETDLHDAVALQASPELLTAVRMVPFAGRTFDANDARPDSPSVVILGYETWQQRFRGDPSIIGRSVKIGVTPVPRQVVGIAPPGFRFPANVRTELVVPMRPPLVPPTIRKNGWTFAAARLKPGISMEDAGAQLAALSQQMEQEHPEQNAGSQYFLRPLRDDMVGETRPALLLLLSAVGLVLLIACANVANLMAARSLGRRQEMALRIALGAGRRQIIMQLAAESLALALVSGTCAVMFAYWATPALVSLVPASVNLAALGGIRMDGAVLLFAALISIGTTLIFSLFSGLGIRRDMAARALGSPGRATAGVTARRATSALVAAEIALAIVLLSGAGLVLRSFSNLLAVDPGFSGKGVLTLQVAAPSDRYRAVEARAALQGRIFDAIANLPGVEAVGAATVTPLTGNNWTVPFERADRPVPRGQRPPDVGWQSATGGYFLALGVPLRAGRLFSAEDGPSAPPVVIISEAVQDQFFPGESAVGHRVKLDDQTAEIVGVVGNIRRAAITDAPHADMYFPQEHAPGTGTTLFIRSTGDPAAIVPAVRTALRSVEPGMVLRDVRSMDDVMRESVQVTRLALWLLTLFAGTAVALAAVGIYGVMSYAVKGRMREIGTRMALGASRASILRLVLGQGARIAIIGASVGVGCALVAGRALRSLLYSTSATDPYILLGSAVLLLAVAVLACYLPARRATAVDPMTVLTQ